MRVFATGQRRKADADGHSVALAATRMTGQRPVVYDQQLAVLRILAYRRRALGEGDTRMISRLHCLLLGLIPGHLEEPVYRAAKALLARVGPHDAAGKTLRPALIGYHAVESIIQG